MLGRRSRASAAEKPAAETLRQAATALAEAAERMTDAAPAEEGAAIVVGGVADAVRPRRWRRRVRRLVIVGVVAGGVYVVITRTPLKAKLSELVFGPPLDEDESEPITLPVSGSPVEPAAEAAPHHEEEAEGEAREPSRGSRPRRTKSSTNPEDGAPA